MTKLIRIDHDNAEVILLVGECHRLGMTEIQVEAMRTLTEQIAQALERQAGYPAEPDTRFRVVFERHLSGI